MRLLVMYLVAASVLVSCGGAGETNVETDKDSSDLICIMPAPNRLNELSWMLGEWKNETDSVVKTESWTQTNDELYSGAGYAIEIGTGDTAFSESIRIHHESTGLVYSPVVKDQNEGEAVDFLLTILSDSLVQFENRQHDFPQVIVYRRFGDDSIVATVSGVYEGKEESEIFPMKRVK